MADQSKPSGYAIHHQCVASLPEQLQAKAKGYSGHFRRLLENSAYVITQYGTDRPFQDCVMEHAMMFTHVGFQVSAKIAAKMGHQDVADAIKAEAKAADKRHEDEKIKETKL